MSATPDRPPLFHQDNDRFFDYARMRAKAKAVVAKSSLINRCAVGDRQAVQALQLGFYAYVADFQQAIDQKANSSKLPRRPLYDKFGAQATRQTIVGQAQQVKKLQKSELAAVFTEAERHLMEMQREERTHWHHWVHDGMGIGLSRTEMENAFVVPGVKRLIAAAHADDLIEFFAGSLAATEFMAEELGNVLAYTPAYRALFTEGTPEQKGRPTWMIVHTVPHLDGPSHADIVLDFARAYSLDETPDRIHALVELGLELFGHAADQVEFRFAPMAVAAE